MFPVNSTSVEKAVIKRVARVLNRSLVGFVIQYAGCYNCRSVAGSSTYSQHSWGNALDLFPVVHAHDTVAEVQKRLRRIANATVKHATKHTVANLGRPIKVSQVIDHDASRIWTPEHGWQHYSGAKGGHIHVSGAPLQGGKPPCAG